MLDEPDVDALVARLRDELELTAAGSSERPGWEPARIEAGRLAQVSGDRAFYRHPGAIGRVRYYATAAPKIVMRKLVRWYVEPIAAEQRAFNGAVLRLIDDVTAWTASGLHAATERADALSERADALTARVDAAERTADARESQETRLEDRLLRLERRPAGASVAAAASPASGAAPPPFDYFAFEGRMRENRDEIRRRQQPYVDDFRDAAPVLDVGCGRGEFLTLLRDAGIEARGVDADADMAAFCRGEGLDVEHGDALAYLEATGEASLGGIFAAHVVEHMPPPVIVRFLELAASRLRPGGVLILETPNPVSLVALKHYFADLSHVQPLVPETLAFLVRGAGLVVEETRYLNEPSAAERLRPVQLPSDERWAEAQAALDADVHRLNEVVFGPQDYAVVARRPQASQ
ncbi:MAG: class I SAM-dependent methyltransferase [Gaiellaceae bacterium]